MLPRAYTQCESFCSQLPCTATANTCPWRKVPLHSLFRALETLACLPCSVFCAHHRAFGQWRCGSMLERRQGCLAESEPEAAGDRYRERQLSSSRAGGLQWDFSLCVDCCWFCGQLMLAKCTSCQGSLWAVLAASNPRYVEVRCPCPLPSTS